jgi:hypothetical protein
MKKKYDEAQEEVLVGDKEKKAKKGKKKDKKREEEDKDGPSRPQTRYMYMYMYVYFQTIFDKYLLRSQTVAKKADTSGFRPPPEKCLEFTFHVLLPMEVWNWGKKSHMHMRFSHPKLGEWKENVGEFKIKK